MLSINIFLTALLAIFTFVTAEDPNFYLINDCNFDVYVREAIGEHPGYSPIVNCANFGESQEVVLAGKGGTGYGSFPVYQDGCGHSYKVARQPRGEVYQFEFTWAHEGTGIWYDLSHINGNPFKDVEREMSPHNGCPTLHCDAGNDGSQCDYDIQKNCPTPSPIAGFLCGRTHAVDWKKVKAKAVSLKSLPPAP
ncbi:hypothetical protein HBI56_075670 [Parastagonospora nodorum]|uniref:Osmotin, thaumatin-like protein n=1 Tax=Phaeosphaeria nodorum (strain SN15 / ATCC MYA-4574 / FGSC 10173) TaxID=321614 RepID=A0A7U2F0M0_PHANO|nr:hypothetical protein HBH56_169320 [Parastagonospora nodorum]QRC94354.1 hypothetical protein JI435_075960 [Parastagonospora nodorum SN15]KAH3928441.1 hypothetical protein HBH54_137870 [Parastagonospora nodorum]KAH3945447.1 hypothetical protein HBH53_143220 [Parastagonospora nodorum]KAH3984106.1 hypothetical protein HBH52_061000 [Parastagonospora nodorum]